MIRLGTCRPDLERAVALLRAGKLVAFPTETVYGLGADASDPDAVARVFAAKGRPADHPVIVHLPDAGAMKGWAREIPDTAWRLAEAFWPGPLTLVLRRGESVSPAITGGQDTVGVRVPGHPVALALLRAFQGALAAPSANRFGRISPTTVDHVLAEFDAVDADGSVAAVIDGGPCRVGVESSIVDLTGAAPRLLRPGMISIGQLTDILRARPIIPPDNRGPRASGRLESHYAPATPVERVEASRLEARIADGRARGEHLAVLARSARPPDQTGLEWIEMSDEPGVYAQRLYAALRELDQADADRILVVAVPDQPDWAAIADRLLRASGGSAQA